ncbi:RT0821/Lpp0805 family surface protein [Candidatus Tisiphia endosymbiont of Oplodontha viridula]|uniref:RT0821/Lpp0805 family surface protein n=1 Tax=Candidatus Tisiphia endosymbiont of Oplodontha viridula TaxID=3077925 RepID=UPI0035C8AA4C
MNLTFKITAIILAATMLHGCTGMNKQGGGTLIGGVAGGLLGSQFGKGTGQLAATGIGALAGALIGGQIGQTMDEHDRQLAQLSSQKALETGASGQSVEWRNPDSGNYGYVTPERTFKNERGQYCREYTHAIVVSGKQEKAYGIACRKPDGQWEIVK